MLDCLHSGHLGRDKMKSLARSLCWWPSIDSDIASFAGNCEGCFRHKPNNHPKWYPWPATYSPMARVHADYCGPFLGKYYALVIEDSYSKYPEVYLTTSASAEFTMVALRKFFTREGIPHCLVTDNGTHFTGQPVKDWLREIGVIQLFSAPRHPCSNGLAERFVQTLKNAIRAGNPQSFPELDKYLDNFLMQYRNAVHSSTKKTPSFLFKGRNLRTSAALDTTDVMFYRGNESRPASGVMLRPVGRRMVEIMDQDDGSVHRRHMDQIHISKPTPRRIDDELPNSVTFDPQLHSTPKNKSSFNVPFPSRDQTNDPQESDPQKSSVPSCAPNSEQRSSSFTNPSSSTNPCSSTNPRSSINLSSSRPKRNVKPPVRFQDYVLS